MRKETAINQNKITIFAFAKSGKTNLLKKFNFQDLPLF